MLPDHKTNPPGSSPGSATSQVTFKCHLLLDSAQRGCYYRLAHLAGLGPAVLYLAFDFMGSKFNKDWLIG